jgi:hypothetical protein
VYPVVLPDGCWAAGLPQDATTTVRAVGEWDASEVWTEARSAEAGAWRGRRGTVETGERRRDRGVAGTCATVAAERGAPLG